MSTRKAEKGGEAVSFEKALSRVETIVKEMEGGALALDDMIARFEEGQSLIAFCSRKLNEVERRIEKLVRKGDRVETAPLDEKENGDAEGDADGEGDGERDLF
ncbi:MAG: exodeoxyribonuclease VII small subunit [Lentisphaerae bacterium]|nr:exodeoxyribonuclease VII small subunit [Lentisphaerota bacterium]